MRLKKGEKEHPEEETEEDRSWRRLMKDEEDQEVEEEDRNIALEENEGKARKGTRNRNRSARASPSTAHGGFMSYEMKSQSSSC